ncbi:Actophorin, partial [Intoshia linei]
ISGFNISDEIYDIIDEIYKRKQRYVILKFNDEYTNLVVVKKGGRESIYNEVHEYVTTECAKSFCYVYFDFNYKTHGGQARDKVVCLKMGIPEQTPIKEKMIYASAYKSLQDSTKSIINIDCTDKASFEFNYIVNILLTKHESTN